ncbi:MAG: hypothetical protein JO013_09215 [Alphaproteobacteria bacterium]|nr:hypothetical protein [Alphaproteobacteria bacterium]
MTIDSNRPHRRPKLYLPLFLEREMRDAQPAGSPFPMTPEQLRRSVAEMIG